VKPSNLGHPVYVEMEHMPRTASTLSLPPFTGAVRTLIFANSAIFFAILILRVAAPTLTTNLLALLLLQPASIAHGAIWQLATYCFIHLGIFDLLFPMMTLWFCGSMLEGAYGSRWLTELYLASAIGGALIASAISFTGILHLAPLATANGAWAGIFGMLIAIAMRFGDQELALFGSTIPVRAKYFVAFIGLFMVVTDRNIFAALLHLSGALAGFLFVRYSPRRGLAYGFSEQYYGLRNAYYRAKRRRAARKFEVYMGKKGRKVPIDPDGRYVNPDDKKDPTDKRWMN
jgi:membrane associated rhomboid family serine protease